MTVDHEEEKEEYAITLQMIQEAQKRIDGKLHRTPILTSSFFNQLTNGKELFFKCENFQKSGSFKIRGATNAIAIHASQERVKKTFITHSSGNHAQALALAAAQAEQEAFVVMPENASLTKKQAVRGYGATVIPCASTNAARQAKVDEILSAHPEYIFIHPSNDPDIMSGQGTMGLEILDQVSTPLDAVVVPIGGGGLCSGIAMAMKSSHPDIQIIGVEPEGAADAYRSFGSKQLQGHDDVPCDTIADGLRTTLGSHNWPIIRDFVDEIVLVSDDEIIAAMEMLWTRMKIVVEPSAAVATAAVVFRLAREPEKYATLHNIAVVVCGGNIDLRKLPWNP